MTFKEIIPRLRSSSDLKYLRCDRNDTMQYFFLTKSFSSVWCVDRINASPFGDHNELLSVTRHFEGGFGQDRFIFYPDGFGWSMGRCVMGHLTDGSIDLKTFYYSLLSRANDLNLENPIQWALDVTKQRFERLVDGLINQNRHLELYVYLCCNWRIFGADLELQDQKIFSEGGVTSNRKIQDITYLLEEVVRSKLDEFSPDC
ncbi:Hypothetical protein POVR1_LOCUS101 [uncultured virus]|nr:Hypothetical protein POVR1_LOCUS101 [uncultured virus]